MSRIIFNNSASATIGSWFARSYIAGRDGTVTTTRATGRTNPIDGTLLGNNVPATTQISLGGLPLTMYGCWGQRTNVRANSSGDASVVFPLGAGCAKAAGTPGTGISSGTPGTIAKNSVTSGARGQFNVTVSSATVYTFSAYVLKETGSFSGEYLAVGEYAELNGLLVLNAFTGVASSIGSKISSYIIQPMGNWWRVSITHSGLAGSTFAAAIFPCYNFSGGQTENTAVGSGQARTVDGAQLEQASFPGPYIPTAGSAVTHNAELLTWALPSGINTGANPELVWIPIPYLWSSASGATHPVSPAARYWQLNNGFGAAWRGTTNWQDSVPSNISAFYTAPAESSGQTSLFSTQISGTALMAFSGLSQVASAAGSTPWITDTSIRLLNSFATDREYFGFGSFALTPGGLTPAERSALNSLKPSTINFAS